MLFGREQELATIRAAFESGRLVALVGPGGVGKTALARETAITHNDSMFADLAPLSGRDIAEGVAGSLRFSAFEDLTRSIGNRHVLLILDNCEHVLDAAAALTDRLLAQCPNCAVLATSREPLALSAEHVVRVEPLSVDGDPSPAVEMYLAEVSRRGLDAPVDPAAAAALCRRLDGLPLAMELAAARASVMTEEEMLDHLTVRLDLLSRSRARGPRRHQSLAATIGWSYHLLEPAHRGLFTSLAVFPGLFTTEMVVDVVRLEPAEAINGLAALVDQSLVVHEPHEGTSTYRLLDTIRTYAAEHLEQAGTAAELEDRLVDAAVRYAVDIAARADAADPEVPLRLERLYRTLQWAIDRCVQHDAEPHRAVALVAALWWLEDVGHQAEAADVVEHVVATWPDATALGATSGVLAGLHRYAGRRERSERAARHAIESGDGFGVALAQRALGQYARSDGAWDEAREHFAAAHAAATRAGKPALAAEIELHQAITTARSGDVDGGIKQIEKVVESTADYPLVDAVAHAFLGWLLLAVDVPRARAVAVEGLQQSQEMRYRWGIGSAHMTLAVVSLLDQDTAGGATHAASAIQEFDGIRDRTGISLALLAAAAALGQAGQTDVAAEVAAARYRYIPGRLGAFEETLFGRVGAPEVDPHRWEAPAVGAVVARLRRLTGDVSDSTLTSDFDGNLFILDGDFCIIRYCGTETRQRAGKGFVDLGKLLASPGREVAALDLMGAAVVSGDVGPLLDAEARVRYEARIRELQEDIDAAERFGDEEGAGASRYELEQLAAELSRAFGLGGLERSAGQPAEKARSAVTHRIRDAIAKIEASHPKLADHLRRSVRTGRFCVYAPEDDVVWEVRSSGTRPT